MDYLYSLEQLKPEFLPEDLGPGLTVSVQSHHLAHGWVIGANAFTTFLQGVSDWPTLRTNIAEHWAALKQIGPAPLRDLANALQTAILTSPLMPELVKQLEQVQPCGEFVLHLYLWQADNSHPIESCGMVPDGYLSAATPDSPHPHPQFQSIAERIKRVWAALFQAKNLLIWAQQGLHLDDLRVAILLSADASFLNTNPIPNVPKSPGYAALLEPLIEPAIPQSPANSAANRTFAGLAAATGQALAPALVLPIPGTELVDLPSGRILVTPSLQPEWLPLLQRSAGIICKTSGMTSHAAIMARELGLPAVVGLGDDLTYFQTEQWLWLNGDQGLVTVLPGPPPRVAVTVGGVQPSSTPSPMLTADLQKPLRTQVMVSCSQPQTLFQLQELPIDGVGLLRSELMLINALEGQHPYLWLTAQRQPQLLERLQANIEAFVLAFQPRPVFYRSLDLRSHECRALIGGTQWEPVETNPMLGLRGVSRYLLYPELFDLELAALAAVLKRQDGPLRLILPFVRSVEEFLFCRQRLETAGLFAYPQFQLWMMAEVPAILFLLPEFVQAGAQGITIGCNDLTQLLLGVDRESDSSKLNSPLNLHSAQPNYDLRHPAVQAAITQLVQSAQQLGIGCSLCGELPLSDPSWVNWLVAQNLPCISVASELVLGLRQALQNAEHSAPHQA